LERKINPLLIWIAEFLFPATCLTCRARRPRWSSSVICARCASQIIPYQGSYRALVPEIDFFHAAGFFQGPLRRVILAFKYQRKAAVTPFLIDFFVRTCSRPLTEIDCVIPVPLSWWSELRRGYNQSKLLADEIGRRYGKPVHRGCLRRRWGPSQTRLSRSARFQNASAGFRLSRSHSLQRLNTVLLIDDVCTTGATLRACARLLKKAGVKRVWGGTIAQKVGDFRVRKGS